MTSGKIHIFGGLILTGFVISFFFTVLKIRLIDLPVVVIIIFLYSQLPDIDHKMSNITWLNLILGITLLWIGHFTKYDTTLFGMILLTVIVISVLKFPHRGPTHTMWFVFASPFLLLFLPDGLFYKPGLMISAAIACYSHLLLDGYWFKLTLKSKKKDFTILSK